jgi:hypothetical protein
MTSSIGTPCGRARREGASARCETRPQLLLAQPLPLQRPAHRPLAVAAGRCLRTLGPLPAAPAPAAAHPPPPNNPAHLQVEQHHRVVQEVRRLARGALGALRRLERLAQLARLLPHLLAQQLRVGQQPRRPRGLGALCEGAGTGRVRGGRWGTTAGQAAPCVAVPAQAPMPHAAPPPPPPHPRRTRLRLARLRAARRDGALQRVQRRRGAVLRVVRVLTRGADAAALPDLRLAEPAGPGYRRGGERGNRGSDGSAGAGACAGRRAPHPRTSAPSAAAAGRPPPRRLHPPPAPPARRALTLRRCGRRARWGPPGRLWSPCRSRQTPGTP